MKFQEKATRTFIEINKLLKKNKIQMRPIVSFKSNKVPFISKICLWIVRKQGGAMDFQFIDINKLK